jgi:hypothetical protein
MMIYGACSRLLHAFENEDVRTAKRNWEPQQTSNTNTNDLEA